MTLELESSWESHKDSIRNLYILRNEPLKDVITHMREEHGFDKTKSQYASQFRKWGLRKNSEGSDWKAVHRKLQSRKEQGKKSAVYKNGRRVEDSKLVKERRHDFRKLEEWSVPAPVAQTPEGFVVHTPLGLDIPPLLVNNLPCLQLFRHLQCIARAQTVSGCEPRLPYLLASSHHSSEPRSRTNLQSLSEIQIQAGSTPLSSPWTTFFADLQHGEVLSDCYASLESAKRHCGRGESRGPQHALSLIYLASNNLLDYRNTASAFEMICGSGNHDLLEAITTSGFFAVKAMAKAFVPAAVRSGNIPLVKAILNLGIDPNSYDEATCCSPLGIAIKMRQVDMASTLLAYGADANGRSRTATLLAEAVETGSLELVQTMLSSGADVNAISTSTLWPRTTALHEAVKSGDIEITQLLLCCGADVDSLPDPAGRTLLWKAARTGNPTLVTLLLTCGANDSMSGLSAAIEAGSQEILQLLLVYGQHEPPNECYEGVDGKNIALQTAASVGDMGLVNFFLDIGAKVNALPPSSGKSALQAAVYAGHVDMVDRFLYLGANVNLEPAECGGMTALQQAVECENMELVGLLLDCGADINADPAEKNGYTALQAAISNGNLHLARYLIRLGADVNAYGCPGCSALELAVEHGRDNPDLLRLVLESGAKDALQWRYALETAIREYADLEIFEILLDYGFDVNERSDEDIPILVLALEGEVGADTEVLMLLLRHGAGDLDDALYVAARKDDIEHMELLLEWGANADAAPTPRNNHMTALSVAVRYNRGAAVQILLEECACDYEGALQQAARAGYTKFVKKFLRLGANVNASIPNDWNMETTALEYAAKSGNVDILRLLLDAGAKVDCEAVPRSCTTALQCAAMKGNLGVVDELLQRGADVNAPPRGHSGRTALEGAAENGRLDIVQLLINVNADVGSSRALEFAREAGHEAVVELLERL